MSITTYNFYNKDWFIAADVVKHYKLSSNYNTYYSKFYSNGRLFGPLTSYEFRLSESYLEEFKSLYGANNASLNKSNAVWLIDEETVRKLLNKDIINSKEKTVKTVESNALSIKYNLGVDKTFEELKIKQVIDNKEKELKQDNASTTYQFDPFNPSVMHLKELDELRANITSGKTNFLVDTNIPVTNSRSAEEIRDYKSVLPSIPIVIDEYRKPKSRTIADLSLSADAVYSMPIDPSIKSINSTYSKYSEEEISDCITLLSSKLTNTPYQQEKLLECGSIRLDLFSCTRRSIYAIELKKGLITLDMIKEKLETKHYLTSIINEYPDLNITFIFSSPQGISWEGLLYLQEASKSVGPHKIIYKPCSNLILDMINKKEKDLPSYYYKQILDKPIIKYLLQVS